MSPIFNESSIILNNQSARCYHFQTSIDINKPHVHFYAGNGFAVGGYEPLLLSLASQVNLHSLAMRGYWYDKPDIHKIGTSLTREQDADLLISYLEMTQDNRQRQPIIGIGHSQGATATAIAAAKRPDLFKALYLIEPVTFTKIQKLIYDLIPKSIKLNNEPFKSTLKKQNCWKSIDSYYQYLRNHRAFKRICDEHLYTYAKNSLIVNAQGQFELLFSPEQELANYFGTPFINDALKSLNTADVPYHLIIGKPSLFISDKVRKAWQGFIPMERITILSDFGHLLPMEAPEIVAEQILSLITFEQ